MDLFYGHQKNLREREGKKEEEEEKEIMDFVSEKENQRKLSFT